MCKLTWYRTYSFLIAPTTALENGEDVAADVDMAEIVVRDLRKSLRAFITVRS